MSPSRLTLKALSALFGTATLLALPSTMHAKVDTRDIKPAKVADEWIETHFQNEEYGFLLLKSGTIVSMHDAKGTILFREIGGWTVQIQSEGFHDHGEANDAKGRISKSKGADGSTIFEIKKTSGKYLEWNQKITCFPKKLQVEINLEFIEDAPTGPDTNIIIGSAPDKSNFAPNFELKPATNPAIYEFKGGTRVELKYDDRFRWFQAPSFTGASFYLDFKGKKEKGQKDSIKLVYSLR